MSTQLAIQLLILLILSAFFIFFAVQFFNIIFRGFAPFVSADDKAIKKIISELSLRENAIVYEFGCGRAGFLRALHTRYPDANLIGVEYSFLPYLIACLQTSFCKKIKIVKKNIFNVDVYNADAIYCYLNSETMKALEYKFQKECRPGAQIVSLVFRLPNMKCDKEIDIGKKEKAYFYKM